jgi:two-component system OmpR family response regulator
MKRQESRVEDSPIQKNTISPYRLLIIEDDKDIVSLVSRVAEEVGFVVCATCDFPDILSSYDIFSPHVIVLDILMPGMDGFEVLNLLYKYNSSARIVILSGESFYRPLASRMAIGFELAIVANIPKPFRLSELRQTLEKIKLSLPLPEKKLSGEAA